MNTNKATNFVIGKIINNQNYLVKYSKFEKIISVFINQNVSIIFLFL